MPAVAARPVLTNFLRLMFFFMVGEVSVYFLWDAKYELIEYISNFGEVFGERGVLGAEEMLKSRVCWNHVILGGQGEDLTQSIHSVTQRARRNIEKQDVFGVACSWEDAEGIFLLLTKIDMRRMVYISR